MNSDGAVPTRGRSVTSPSTRPAAAHRRTRGLLGCRVIGVERLTFHLICMMQVVSVPPTMSLVSSTRVLREGECALDYTEVLRRLAINDERFAEGVVLRGVGSRSTPKTLTLDRLAALVGGRWRGTVLRSRGRLLGVVISGIPRGSQLVTASGSEQPHLPRLRASGDAVEFVASDLTLDAMRRADLRAGTRGYHP